MNEAIAGIHHVTAIATDPQKNVEFYERTLGLRLVKKTVNFDDPRTYHLYYGDELGRPGTILTFFPWPTARRGRRDSGQVTATAFSVAEDSLGFWKDHLRAHGVVAEEPRTDFGEQALAFDDPDCLKLELVAGPAADPGQPWDGGIIPPEHSIRGLHAVTLTVRELNPTAALLTETMGLRAVAESGNRFRFEADEGTIARRVDVLHTPETGFGNVAAGTVHHVAWRVPDEPSERRWRDRLASAGLDPTRVLDRQYFKSIYFREPGGVLFEFATDLPGFTLDEKPEHLGTDLKLPPWLEPERERIEKALPVISRPVVSGRK